MKRIILSIAIALWGICGTQMYAQSRIIEFNNPKFKVFLPPARLSNQKAIVACPGGGYSHLAKDHEGYDWAAFYNNLGFAYAVIEYKLPAGNKSIPMDDVRECFKIMADSAASWRFNPNKIGIMGSSAGGHLASALSTHPTADCKPAFQILFYPVISLENDITHQGTRKGFLGETPQPSEIEKWSSDKNVTPATPPAFLVLSSDDKGVKPLNSILYYNALIENKVPAAMFIYPYGGHGWGFRTNFKHRAQMLEELTAWLSMLDNMLNR